MVAAKEDTKSTGGQANATKCVICGRDYVEGTEFCPVHDKHLLEPKYCKACGGQLEMRNKRLMCTRVGCRKYGRYV